MKFGNRLEKILLFIPEADVTLLHGGLTQPSNYHQCSFWFQELATKISAIAGYKSFTAGIDHFIIHIFTLIKKRIMGSKVSDWTGS